MNVAVIGASNKPDRYSYKALKQLNAKGHRTFGVHPRIKEIEGVPVFASIKEITESIDTITLYVAADVSQGMGDDLISKHPRRIIFNPGAENPALARKAEEKGIQTLNACTLVLLSTGQF